MMRTIDGAFSPEPNPGEGRHSVARAVFHGQRGKLRQRYREGQEDQLGALGLVVNAIVFLRIRCIWKRPSNNCVTKAWR